MAAHARGDFRRHVPFVHRLVGQHRLPHHVTDGEDVRRAGAHLLVDRNIAAFVHRDARVLRPQQPPVRPAADGDQHAVEHGAAGPLRAFEMRGQPFGAGFHLQHLGLQHDGGVALLDPLHQRRHQILVGTGNNLVHQLDHRDGRAQSAVHRRHLQPDDAAADHQQAGRDVGQVQGARAVDHPRVLVRHEGQGDGFGAGGDDGLVERNGLAAAIRLHGQLVRRGEAAQARHHGHLALPRQAAQPAGQALDHARLPIPQLVDVHLRGAEADAGMAHLRCLVDHLGGVQQGLAGDAAHVQAHPAQHRPAFHQDNLLAQIGGAERRRVAARSGAEHQYLGMVIPLAADRGLRHRCRGFWHRRHVRPGGDLVRGHVLASLQQHDQAALAHPVAHRQPDFPHRPTDGRGDVHGRLVGFQGQQRVFCADLGPGGHVDLDHRDVLEVTDVGDLHFQQLVYSALRAVIGRFGRAGRRAFRDALFSGGLGSTIRVQHQDQVALADAVADLEL